MICGLFVGKIYKYEFRLYLQNLSEICKMGITFAYELGLKFFYMKNHLLENLHPNLTGGVKHFQNPQKPNRKKDTGLLRSREAKKNQKNSNLLMAHLPMVRL